MRDSRATRRRGFEPRGVLRFIGNSDSVKSAHVVVVAYCCAVAEARVRLPLGTLSGQAFAAAEDPL